MCGEDECVLDASSEEVFVHRVEEDDDDDGDEQRGMVTSTDDDNSENGADSITSMEDSDETDGEQYLYRAEDIYDGGFVKNWFTEELDWPDKKYYCRSRAENWFSAEDYKIGIQLSHGQQGESFERCFRGHSNHITIKSICFAGPDDCWVVSGSDDGRFFVWDRKTGDLLDHFRGESYIVNCIACAPHRPLFASCGIDPTVKLWDPIGYAPPFQRNQQWYSSIVRNEFRQYNVNVDSASFVKLKKTRELILQQLQKEQQYYAQQYNPE
eukprot:TRINITY_DN13094_c0_g1_i2.p1 TRINITY_DN13094_c0_g1~~TRINITY_DN13094_c0_g1_i2.p1  ORF type:complete len:268 (-),score=47.54 TRINITY_DN13094_c0_g1_i2:476-1279(-)